MKIWQISVEDHSAVLDVIYDRYPYRSENRADWGQAEYVFCVSKGHKIDMGEIEEWLLETETTSWVEHAGAYVFVELKSEADAVAFKLRWC